MAITRTPRFRLPQWGEGSDKYPGRVGWNDILTLLDGTSGNPGAALAIPSGPLSARPEGGTFGRFFLATDQGTPEIPMSRLYYDGGTGWVEINTNGGGGAGQPVVINGTATEGRSPRSARSDHTHNIPVATSARPGAMSAAFAAMLEKAIYGPPTPSTMPIRNWRGAIQVANPQDPLDAANKRWVEDEAGYSSLKPDTLVRRFTNNNFRAGFAEHLDDVVTRRYLEAKSSWDDIANTIVTRGTDRTFYVGAPTKAQNPATKSYVDARASRQEWKTNVEPIPYGLPEILSLTGLIFDYRTTDDVPAEVRGTTREMGAFVDEVAADMPLLVTHDAEGNPERIRDRQLIWPVIRAVQELAETNGELAEENKALRGQVKTLERKARALESELAQIKHHLGL